jgi:hypothetical protein
MGASATLTKVEHFDSNSPELIAYYDIAIPGFGIAAGEKMLLPVSPLTGPGQHPFRHAARAFPVYFPYLFHDFDDIIITLPEGWAAEVRPEPRRDDNDFSSYSLVSALEPPDKLHIQRALTIKRVHFPVEQYAAVKALFDSVRASDEAQVILTRVQK